jgi:hypothetical protein
MSKAVEDGMVGWLVNNEFKWVLKDVIVMHFPGKV